MQYRRLLLRNKSAVTINKRKPFLNIYFSSKVFSENDFITCPSIAANQANLLSNLYVYECPEKIIQLN